MQQEVSRLVSAERRLQDAVTRLETALALTSRRVGADAPQLRAECDRLTETLGDVRKENDALRELSKEAAGRLDRAIAQIDTMLQT